MAYPRPTTLPGFDRDGNRVFTLASNLWEDLLLQWPMQMIAILSLCSFNHTPGVQAKVQEHEDRGLFVDVVLECPVGEQTFLLLVEFR